MAQSVERRRQLRAWSMLAAGTAVAAAEAWLVFSRLRPTPKRFVVGEIFWSALMVGICVSGGAAAAWLAGLLVREEQPGDGPRVWKNAAVGWAFLPCLAMLAQRESWWIFPIAALATVAAMCRLLPELGIGKEDAAATLRPENPGLQSLYGLGVPEAPPWRSWVMAACAQATVILAAREWLGVASAALCLCVVLWLVWWGARSSRWERIWAGRRRAAELLGAAVLLMVLLTPWLMGGGGGSSVKAAGIAKGPNRAGEPGHSGADWVGIVLWPPPKKKVDITPPRPNAPVVGHGIGTRPMVIPFDGPYWYFKDPYSEPGPKAHVTFGEPTEAHVRSTDWNPLRMQAHMNLGLPIDMSCCREIDVTLTNADLHVGTIEVSVVLADTSGPRKRSVALGMQPILSSEPGGPSVAGKVRETLKFVVPPAARIQHFDEINVVIQPMFERARLGSKVKVEQFELVPR